MLYVSTRNRAESFTAFRVLREKSAPDGGKFVPFQMQPLQENVLKQLRRNSFQNAVAQILNFFFSTKLTAWDIELCVGRNVVNCRQLGRRLIIAEAWRNPQNDYAYLEKALYAKLTGKHIAPPAWVKIAIRTAVLFGIYSQIHTNGIHNFDVVADSNEPTSYLAAFYARYLGLPINMIIIGCDDTSGLWDLMVKGEIPTTATGADGMETLLYACLGYDEVARFRHCMDSRRVFSLDETQVSAVCDGFYASVIGSARPERMLSSFYHSNQYVIAPDTAAAYCALQDYRAKIGESRYTLLFSERCPLHYADRIQNATSLTYDQIAKKISKVKE